MTCTKESCRPRSVFEELDRGLSEFMKGVLSPETSAPSVPGMTVFEKEDRYQVECDLPGIPLENIELSVENRVLTINGRRKQSQIDKSVKVLLNERPVDEFRRSLQLAKNADLTTVDAELSNGVLLVTIMKRPEVLPKKIQIRRSGLES